MPFRPKDVLRSAKDLERQGKRKEASAEFARLSIYLRKRKKGNEALMLIERAIRLSEESARLYLQKALCELMCQKESEAIYSTRQFTKYAIAKGKSETYRHYLEEEAKEFPKLRRIYYEGVLKIDRTDPSLLITLAKAHIECNDFAAAKVALVDTIRSREGSPECLRLLTQVLKELKDSAGIEALEAYQQGEIETEDILVLLQPRPRETKGEVNRSGNEKLVPLGTLKEKTLGNMIRDLEEKLGIALEEKRDTVAPLLEEFRKKADHILASDAKARMDMSLAFYEMGLLNEAKLELDRIPRTDPEFWTAQVFRGEILSAEGSDLDALELYNEILRDARLSEHAWLETKYKLVQVYFRLGDYQKCVELVDEIREKDPKYREINVLRSHILTHVTRGQGSIKTSGKKKVS